MQIIQKDKWVWPGITTDRHTAPQLRETEHRYTYDSKSIMFLVEEERGREDPNTTKKGHQLACERNAN